MLAESEMMFQLGAIMLLAFIAATLAGKMNQSVMIGYILIGVFIGPRISIDVFGVQYHGLIRDTSFVDMMSQIGLVMLMFFVGLEFSFSKLKRVRTPAIILAVIDTSVGLFVGFVFASILGWPLIDSIFLAGVVAMSSTSIAMKVLFDLKRMSSPEVEFLIGLVVVETFIAMVILAVASGMIVQPQVNVSGYGQLILGIVAFYAFFVWIAMWAVPKVVEFFNNIENDELFILFALGIVFLTSGIASVMNVPPIIGAFFVGMILAESKVTLRVQAKLDSFKDAFVAVFFTAFGMMIDPAMFKDVIWMLALAVPLVLLYEAIVMSAVSYFLGFSAKASTTIGTSMSGRGVESILYASVGSRVSGVTMGAQLNPFAGAFCFIMSAITPPLVKHSASLANIFSRIMPKSLKFSGAVVSRTLGRAIMPSQFERFKGARMTAVSLASFAGVCSALLLTRGLVHVGLFAAGIALVSWIFIALRSETIDIAGRISYSDLEVKATCERRKIADLAAVIVLGAAVSILLIAFSWSFAWQTSLIITAGFVTFVLVALRWAYGGLHSSEVGAPTHPSGIMVYDGRTMSEGAIAGVPEPVYALQTVPSGEMRL